MLWSLEVTAILLISLGIVIVDIWKMPWACFQLAMDYDKSWHQMRKATAALQHIVIWNNKSITWHWGRLASVIWLNTSFNQPTTFPSNHVSNRIPSIEASKQFGYGTHWLNSNDSWFLGKPAKQAELTCGSCNIKLFFQILESIFFQNDLFPKTHLPKKHVNTSHNYLPIN